MLSIRGKNQDTRHAISKIFHYLRYKVFSSREWSQVTPIPYSQFSILLTRSRHGLLKTKDSHEPSSVSPDSPRTIFLLSFSSLSRLINSV